jgi:hypothetical protein
MKNSGGERKLEVEMGAPTQPDKGFPSAHSKIEFRAEVQPVMQKNKVGFRLKYTGSITSFAACRKPKSPILGFREVGCRSFHGQPRRVSLSPRVHCCLALPPLPGGWREALVVTIGLSAGMLPGGSGP